MRAARPRAGEQLPVAAGAPLATLFPGNRQPATGNAHRLVRIRFTTWDAGNEITKYDVDVVRLSDSDIDGRMATLPGWELREGALQRRLTFRDFAEAFSFMTAIAFVAERMNHHPDWSNVYNTVTVRLSTHDVGGISENDFAMAAEISGTYQRFGAR